MKFEKIQIFGDLVFIAPDSKQKIKEAMDKRFVELDFTDVENIDSTGIDLLIRLCDNVVKKNHGLVKIFGVNKILFETFNACELTKIAEVILK